MKSLLSIFTLLFCFNAVADQETNAFDILSTQAKAEEACSQKAQDAVVSLLKLDFVDAELSGAELSSDKEDQFKYKSVYNVWATADDGWYNITYKVTLEKFVNGVCGRVLVVDFQDASF